MRCDHCKSETQTELYEKHTSVTNPQTGELIKMQTCYYEKCCTCNLIYNYRTTEWLDKEGLPYVEGEWTA